MPGISDFFAEIDARWPSPDTPPITVRLFGSTALMLQTGYDRSTKDSDVLETDELRGPLKQALLEMAGKGTLLHHRHRIYLEIVPSAFPFLPQRPRFHPVSRIDLQPRNFRIEVLDVVDVVVSKLARLNADDRADIDAMVARELVPHRALIERFMQAFDWLKGDARAHHLPLYVNNLNRMERDIFFVDETPIDLSGLKY